MPRSSRIDLLQYKILHLPWYVLIMGLDIARTLDSIRYTSIMFNNAYQTCPKLHNRLTFVNYLHFLIFVLLEIFGEFLEEGHCIFPTESVCNFC